MTARDTLRRASRLRRRASNITHELASYEHPVAGLGLSAFFMLARRFTPSISVAHSGMRFYLNTADRSISRRAFVDRKYELGQMTYAIDLARRVMGSEGLLDGKVFVDIGANIGTSTIPAVALFGAARAVSFEPSAGNYQFLRANIAANDMEGRVAAHHLGLSDRAGTSLLELSSTNAGDHRVRLAESVDEGGYGEAKRKTETITLSRFDDQVREQVIVLGDVGLVWIDTQGHEGQVLAGATLLTDTDIPIISEYWPYGLRRADGLDLFHEIVANNYRRVIDIRASEAAGSVVEIAASQIADLADRYPNETYTDVLLLN